MDSKHINELIAKLSRKPIQWYPVAEQLHHIKETTLWRETGLPTWSSWVRSLARRTGRHPEGLFKLISAYAHFHELVAHGGLTEDQSSISAENILLIRAIARSNGDLGVRLYNDVVARRYQRTQLSIIRGHVANTWSPTALQAAVKRGESACMLQHNPIFARQRRFKSPLFVDHLGFDCAFFTETEEATTLHGVLIVNPDQPLDTSKLSDFQAYVQALWVVQAGHERMPEGIGIIGIDPNSEALSILAEPNVTKAPKKNHLLVQLAKSGV